MSSSSFNRGTNKNFWLGVWGISCLGLGACHPRAAPDKPGHHPGLTRPQKGLTPSTKAPLISLDSLSSTPQGLLSFVPARAQGTLILFEVEQLYRQVERLERVLKHNPQGKKLVDLLHHRGESFPAPLPWSVQDLALWGVDYRQPLLAYSTPALVVLLPLADRALFKKKTAYMLKASWSQHQHQGLALETLAGPSPVVCHVSSRWALCSEKAALVIEALRQTPSPTLWSALLPHEKENAGHIAALFAFKDSTTAGTVTAAIHGDGLGVQLRMDGLDLGALQFFNTRSPPSTLLGLAKGAQWVLRARYKLAQLEKFSPQVLIGLALFGLDGVLLTKSLTGEVILFQRAPGELALVIANVDQKSSQQVVEALAKYSSRARPQGMSQEDLPHFSVIKTPLIKTPLQGQQAYRIQVIVPRALQRQKDSLWRSLPAPLTFGLAAIPSGIVLGTWSLVEELSRTPHILAEQFHSSLATVEDKETFADQTSISFLGALGDPLAPLAADLEPIFQRNQGDAPISMGIEVGRFLLDQLQKVTVSYQITDQNSLHVRLRLTTLHRDHHPADDQAQELWLQGLQAKYSGAPAVFRQVLTQLKTRFPLTRFGALDQLTPSDKPRVTGATLLAAYLLPQLLQHLRIPKATEIHPHLARIVSAAKFSHDKRKGFPPSTPWTPAKPCCKSGGTCQPDSRPWQHPTWKALHFSIPEVHRYQYRFIRSKKTFTAEARGDLNCDGVTSHFSIQGTLLDDGSVSLSAMDSQRPLE